VLLADEPTEGLHDAAASELLLTLRLSDPRMTLVIALHDQQVAQLGWEPDTTIDLEQQP
jgi:ABC-type lipoprotein export system ATPase subunit